MCRLVRICFLRSWVVAYTLWTIPRLLLLELLVPRNQLRMLSLQLLGLLLQHPVDCRHLLHVGGNGGLLNVFVPLKLRLG